MNRHLRTALFGITLLLPSSLAISGAAAQAAVTPLDDPSVTLPGVPSGAKESYDSNSIEQLMKLVELTRQIGGGVVQLLGSMTGSTTIPNPAGLTGDGGGTGLKEMADAALNGSPAGPVDLTAALSAFTTSYGLDKAFALKDDTTVSGPMIAHAAAQGAIAAATAEDSYKRANASMARLDGYLTALTSSTTLKASVDINTRVMIEVAQQINETLRTQAALTSVAGTYFMILGGQSASDNFLSGLKNFNR
jgi:hypothetical protein